MKVLCNIKWNKNNIVCICKLDRKKCSCRTCSKGKLEYNQFEGIEKCFMNSEKRR